MSSTGVLASTSRRVERSRSARREVAAIAVRSSSGPRGNEGNDHATRRMLLALAVDAVFALNAIPALAARESHGSEGFHA